jgi:hypothetical protein
MHQSPYPAGKSYLDLMEGSLSEFQKQACYEKAGKSLTLKRVKSHLL